MNGQWHMNVRLGGRDPIRGVARCCHVGVATVAVSVVISFASAVRAGESLIELERERLAIYAPAISPSEPSASHDDTRSGNGGREEARAGEAVFDASRQYFYVPPESTGILPTAEGNGDDPQRAEALFALARRALDAGHGQLAFRLAHEVLQFDPSHEEARRWIGLAGPPSVRTQPPEARVANRPHPRLGWPAGGYRRLTTPHFHITTDDEPAAATRLAETLEELRVVWEQLFFDGWADIELLRARARGGAHRPRVARHQVVMFRDREDYVRFLRTVEAQAELTRGYYHAPTRTVYLIGGAEPERSTWRHEVTHQLFHERLRAARHIGREANFWIIEGAALYMESIQHCRQWVTVGGLEAERLQYARFRALRERFYVPLQALVSMGEQSLQQDERIRRLYSQAAGLTHFLFDGRKGEHRAALIEYLKQVYAGRDRPDTLAQLAGVPLEQLDQQYHEFLQVDDQQLEQLDRDVQIRQLCLGGGRVTDRGLTSLPSLVHARWLDLYGLPITDSGTEVLSGARQLEQLSLERTQISDATVARLRTARGLKQLDLSGTRITDLALTTVGQLTQLEALWLTDTNATDDGLRQLEPLKQLRTLELSGTRTTPEGRTALRRALPQWQAE